MLKLIAILIVCSLQVQWSSAAGKLVWGYKGNTGADFWPTISKKYCSGRRQSPIKLDNSTSTYDPGLSHYVIKVPDLATTPKYTVYNDGHKVGFDLAMANFEIGLYNNPDICLRPHGIHFHWGDRDNVGSEHWLNGQQYAMEGHLVNWDCHMYSDMNSALNGIDGLGVLGVFYKVVPGAPNDPVLAAIISQFTKANIMQCPTCLTNSSIPLVKEEINAFDITQFIPKNRKNFWRYYGSLTTPDCRENVQWTVFNTPVEIPPSQMQAFRNLKYPRENNMDANMVNNYRDPLPLNPVTPPGPRRLLTRSFMTPQDAMNMNMNVNSATKSSISVLWVLAAAFILLLVN